MNSIVRRKQLAFELRQFRTQAGKTIDEAAEFLQCSRAKISRIERSHHGISQLELRTLLGWYGAPPVDIERLATLASRQREKSWWETYTDVMHGEFIGLESAATVMRSYEPQRVPGLMQIPEYTRAILKARIPSASDSEIERKIALRLARQSRLEEEDFLFDVVVDEAVLGRPIGGPEVMQSQLQKILNLVERPNITFRILPKSIGAHIALDGSFTVLSFPEGIDQDVVYIENLVCDLYLEKPEEVEKYAFAFENLKTICLSPAESAELIGAAITPLNKGKQAQWQPATVPSGKNPADQAIQTV